MKCGCKITYNTSGPLIGHGTIEYCPLHAAAPEMLEALKKAKATINSVYGHHCFTKGLQEYVSEGLRSVVAAISQVERK